VESKVAVLKMLDGEERGRSWELKQDTLIGRDPVQCDIVLTGLSVSRFHARVFENHGTYFIEDARSRNKTYVNGEILERRRQLHDRDVIRICGDSLSFEQSSLPFPDFLLDKSASPAARNQSTDSSSENDSYDSQYSGDFPEIVSVPSSRDRRIPAIADGPDVVDQSSILSSYSLATGGYLQLMNRPEEKLKALMELSKSLGHALTVEQLLPKLMNSLMNAFRGADRAIVLLNNIPLNQLQVRAVQLRDDESTISPPLSTTIIKYALRQKQVVLSNDVQGDERFSSSKSLAGIQIRSVMCAPLMGPGNILLGVIQIDTLNPNGRFVTSDLELLGCLANQAALALDNTRLHKQALEQRDLERDLEFASQVQMGFLPTERPKLANYQFYDFYEPAQFVGGDFFDYIKLPDGRLAIAVGDVAGKGVPAALLMARLYSMTRYSLLTSPTPAAAVTALNAGISTSGLGHRFITFVLAVLDPGKGIVNIVNAGHLPPILRQADGTTHPIPGEGSGLPLGVTADCIYVQTEVKIESGESLFLFTDGLTEAMNPENQIYSQKRIREFLEHQQGGLEHLGESLVADINHFCQGREQFDDICLVCFRRQDGDQPTPSMGSDSHLDSSSTVDRGFGRGNINKA
jgi:sigma-B regulation protein RsbU (phosphoserine phosphatase)